MINQLSKEYKEYLQGPIWASIATGIKERDGWACRICGAKEHLEVHHIRGKHRFHERNHPEDLITLCSECHKSIHWYFEQVDMQAARYAEERFRNKR